MPVVPVRDRLRHRLTAHVAAVGFLVVSVSTAPLAAGALVTDPSGYTSRVSPEQAAPATVWQPEGVTDDRAEGLVHQGLDDTEACPGGYEVEGSSGHGRHAQCSHGPDPAPDGVDVRQRPSVAELIAREEQAASEDGTTAAADPAQVPCYGDGTSGKRLHAVYAVAADKTDRYAMVADLIRGYAANTDMAYAASAMRDGGVRHLRWVTDGSCRLVVEHVVLSATGDDSLPATRAELAALGYNRTDRKYVIWSDATVYCGIAYVAGDARPDASNPANFGPTYARVDSGCWGGNASVEAHEVAHMLGAVTLSAPHSNGGYHCTDEYDRLCYNDGSSFVLTYLCAMAQEPVLDCNGDDYFNVAPVAGSWLASHWNLANSVFLETVEPVLAAPPPTPSPTPTPTPTSTIPTPTIAVVPTPILTAAPIPTTTQTASPIPTPTATSEPARTTSSSTATSGTAWVKTRITGRLSRDVGTRTYRVSTSGGLFKVTATFRGAERVRLAVVSRAGKVVAREKLRSGRTLARSVAEGSYRIRVSGPSTLRFTLKVGRYQKV